MLSIFKKANVSSLPWYTVYFDSATGLANALVNCLHGKSFPGVGKIPESEILARIVNALPWILKKNVYIKGSAKGAINPRHLDTIVDEDFSRWITTSYPAKRYPALMIGSSSGPAVHLAAAMGIPWLPQTYLIPVRTPSHLSVDDPVSRMEWARKPAADLLSANPGLQLHHMMDPNQDRPMLKSVSYFRVKKLHLDSTYKSFIINHLEERGTIFLVDCQKSWPVTRVDERYYFQFGGLGGTSIHEYHNGSNNVEQFLKGARAPVTKWKTPAADITMPESEWGFEKTIGEDVLQLAKERGYKVETLGFDEPEDLSPFVADLYRWWYAKMGLRADKLLAGMFFLIEPYLTLRTGAIPYWMAFNAKSSVDKLKEYLVSAEPFNDIFLMPFSHGVNGQGLASIADYRSALHYAKQKGDFIGSEPDLYPFDFGIYFRYEKDLKRKLMSDYPVNEKLSIEQLHQFQQLTKGKYKVSLI